MPSAGTTARTVTSTPGAPSTVVGRAETSRANRPEIAPSIWSRVRAAPSSGPRSSVAAYRAPSEAADARVLRTSSTSATCRIPRKTGTSTTRTSTKSTTADPRCPRLAPERHYFTLLSADDTMSCSAGPAIAVMPTTRPAVITVIITQPGTSPRSSRWRGATTVR